MTRTDTESSKATPLNVAGEQLTFAGAQAFGAARVEPLDDASADGEHITFTAGSRQARGWIDPHTGAAELSWGGGMRLRHFAGQAPVCITDLRAPQLRVEAGGEGALTFEATTALDDQAPPVQRGRITVATITGADLSGLSSAEGSLEITGTINRLGA